MRQHLLTVALLGASFIPAVQAASPSSSQEGKAPGGVIHFIGSITEPAHVNRQGESVTPARGEARVSEQDVIVRGQKTGRILTVDWK